MTGRIAISVGDVTGIGPEITLKALASELPSDDWQYVLFGDPDLIKALNARLALGLPISTGTRISIASGLSSRLPTALSPGDPEAARAALAWLEAGAQRCLAGVNALWAAWNAPLK